MGFFSRLFGTPKPSKTPGELRALEEGKARQLEQFQKETEQRITWAEKMDLAHKILLRYAGVLEDTCNEALNKNPIIRLYPESILPLKKDVIRWAFSAFFDELERSGKEVFLGMPKSALIVAATSLEENFAPDEQVSNDPKQNMHDYMVWQMKTDPDAKRKGDAVQKKMKENPEAAKALISAIYKTFDGEWEDYFKLRGFFFD